MRAQLAIALLLFAAPALGQEVIEPYGNEAPPAAPRAPSPTSPPVQVAPPVQVTPQPYYYYYQPYPYQPPPARFARPPLVGYREVEQRRYGLMTAGLVLFGASWSLTGLIGYLAGEDRVAIPIVGPLLVAHSLDTSDPWKDAGNRAGVVFLVFDSLVQATGVAMAIAGAATHRRVRILDRARVTVLPTGLRAGAGVVALGHF